KAPSGAPSGAIAFSQRCGFRFPIPDPRLKPRATFYRRSASTYRLSQKLICALRSLIFAFANPCRSLRVLTGERGCLMKGTTSTKRFGATFWDLFLSLAAILYALLMVGCDYVGNRIMSDAAATDKRNNMAQQAVYNA